MFGSRFLEPDQLHVGGSQPGQCDLQTRRCWGLVLTTVLPYLYKFLEREREIQSLRQEMY